MERIHVVDSHTGGEPTRLVIAGGPDLGRGPLAERRRAFRDHHDHFRSAVVNEPRGSDVFVGGLLTEPVDHSCVTGVIFFNNVGYLGMCGHGTIGLLATLAHLDRVGPGAHQIETPVGVVNAELLDANRVRLENVPSYRHRTGVRIRVAKHGYVTGDVAWGGNWFFLVSDHRQTLAYANVALLESFTQRVRNALEREGVTGKDGAEIDHIELLAPSLTPGVDSRSFVLCPGGAYDRSPCGTGTSAKVACLAEDGTLAEGDIWKQESIVGSIFEATYRRDGDRIIPAITGTAFVNAESQLIRNTHDPFVHGIRSSPKRNRK